MGRILAIDYGLRRTGLAVTDPGRIIATGLDTVATGDLLNYLIKYTATNDVDIIVVGMPLQMDGNASESQRHIVPFIGRLKKRFPDIVVETADERFTSVLAKRAMIEGGVSKSGRRDKGLVDKVSAVIILQGYMESRQQLKNDEL